MLQSITRQPLQLRRAQYAEMQEARKRVWHSSLKKAVDVKPLKSALKQKPETKTLELFYFLQYARGKAQAAAITLRSS